MTSDHREQINIEAIARSVIAHKKSTKNRAKHSLNSVNMLLSQPKEELKNLIDNMNKDNTIMQHVLSCVAPQFHGSISACHIENNKLAILVTNGATATQLKFGKTAILSSLRQLGFWEIAIIEIKVSPLGAD